MSPSGPNRPATGPSTVVITGAGRGIGRATALRFARRRWDLVLVDLDAGELDRTADEARRAGARRVAVVDGDVADPETHLVAANRAVTGWGPPEVWVNNAGIGSLGRLGDVPFETIGDVVATNLVGTLNGSRTALRCFEEQGRGVLVNVGSIAGVVALPLQATYAATKAAILAADRALRLEYPDPGIRISTVVPGPVRTPFWENMPNYTGRAERPLQPAISADRVAAAIERCVDRPRARVYVGSTGRLLGAMHRVAPGVTDRIVGRVMPPLIVDRRIPDDLRTDPVRTFTAPGAVREAIRREREGPLEMRPPDRVTRS